METTPRRYLFNHCLLFDQNGWLVTNHFQREGSPREWFASLDPITQDDGHVMLVLQEGAAVFRYMVRHGRLGDRVKLGVVKE